MSIVRRARKARGEGVDRGKKVGAPALVANPDDPGQRRSSRFCHTRDQSEKQKRLSHTRGCARERAGVSLLETQDSTEAQRDCYELALSRERIPRPRRGY